MTDRRTSTERAGEDAALRAIVEGVEAETGDRFFASLVHRLATALGVQYAFVSELSDDRQRFRTRALWGRGELRDNLEFPVAGTPCEAVLNGKMSHHPERLQELFPADPGLVDWGVVSYAGVPLLDTAGVVVGHLAILDDRPMTDGSRGLSIMRIFAARTRAELERQHIEAALRKSEERYRDLYDSAPAAYLSVGADGHVRRWNEHTLKMLGYAPEELAGMHFADLAADTPHGKVKCQEMYEQFLAGLDTVGEIEGQRKDGSRFWVSASVRAMRGGEGEVDATQAVMVDITDRKRAEEALRLSEERVARILASAMDAIVTIDEQHRVEIFNDAAEHAFGCPAAQAIGRTFDRFLTEGFRRALDDSLQAVTRGKPAKPYIWAPQGLKARDADGREFAIEATISSVEVQGRQLYTLILRDVEQRRRAEEELRLLHRQNEYLQEEIRAVHNVDEIVGQSAALLEVLEKVRLVAPTDSSVLILGETGTGKELIARAVHSSSARKDRPLIKVNCAALPIGLIESELFGHEKGAFTGAVERRLGRFELASGGTIFLDEIGEMPTDIQVKLLRVLQEHEIERIGASTPIKVDVRVIAATNRDLGKAIAEGTFRQDLFYRLNVFPVSLPPLRSRPEDIAVLVHYFVSRYAAKIGRRISHIARETMQHLVAYSWPGNVRELENVIERAVIVATGPELTIPAELLPAPVVLLADVRGAPPPTPAPPSPDALPLEQVERGHIVAVLRRTNWRIDGPQGAARLLRMHPSTLRSRMKKLGIQRSAEEFS